MAVSELKKFLTSWRKELVVMGVGLAGLGVVALILWLPPWQAEHVRGRLDKPADEYRLATLEDGHRRTLAQILTGGGLLVGLYLGWRRVRAAEEGQITERFTKAIAQLGDDKMAIRLGGIYALERIASDSEKDHGPIMEVLTAYVRENAPRQTNPRQRVTTTPPTDIQAILTVLGRRETTGKNRRNDPLDLSNTRLVGAILFKANLSEAILFRADLRGADLADAQLSGARLLGANLAVADLSEAKNLTAEQVQSAEDWREADLPEDLLHLKEPPA